MRVQVESVNLRHPVDIASKVIKCSSSVAASLVMLSA